MSTPRGFRDRADDSLFTLLGEVPELVRNLITAEFDAAKAWAKRVGKDAGMGGVWFIIALFFLFWLIPALGAFTIIGLASWMPAWVASLIVVGLGLVFLVVFALLGVGRVRRLSRGGNPAKSLAKDAVMVKEVADEF
ncbi:phage holin family protein [Microbacterium sp.]|uniref:phage holin family protein n=1 Tax=Microbacterium sp. TaxID=51671 RepID=UPI003A8C13B9